MSKKEDEISDAGLDSPRKDSSESLSELLSPEIPQGVNRRDFLMRVNGAPYSGASTPNTAGLHGWVGVIQTVLAF